MGELICIFGDTTQVTSLARNVCPFPDYGPSPLLNNMLSQNSSVHLTQHYAAVQASLTTQQQQDFTQTMRRTFGRDGTVNFGGMKVVALSLAIFFDTVASRVKGEYVSDQEPIPGLFIRDPTGTYPAPVYTVSKYLRLVPHIANNPTRMRDETEKYLLELNRTVELEIDKVSAGKEFDDIAFLNHDQAHYIGIAISYHYWQIWKKHTGLFGGLPSEKMHTKKVLNLNCDPKEASERFKPLVNSLDDKSKETYRECIERNGSGSTVIEAIAGNNLIYSWFLMIKAFRELFEQSTMTDFDLKANALGKWT